MGSEMCIRDSDKCLWSWRYPARAAVSSALRRDHERQQHRHYSGTCMNIEDFYTRDASNEGKEFPLYTADGKPTGHTITIRSANCDAARKVRLKQRRRNMMDAAAGRSLTEDEELQRLQDDQLDLLVACVGGWSFPDFTPENVRHFLINAPEQADTVDVIAGQLSLFFAERPTSSSATSSRKSNSRKSRKAPKAR